MSYLAADDIYCGSAEELIKQIEPESIAVSVWSPPYHVGKNYEADQTYEEWLNMLSDVIKLRFTVLKPGGFLAINIGDIFCFPDPMMPRYPSSVRWTAIMSWRISTTLSARSSQPMRMSRY